MIELLDTFDDFVSTDELALVRRFRANVTPDPVARRAALDYVMHLARTNGSCAGLISPDDRRDPGASSNGQKIFPRGSLVVAVGRGLATVVADDGAGSVKILEGDAVSTIGAEQILRYCSSDDLIRRQQLQDEFGYDSVEARCGTESMCQEGRPAQEAP